MLFIKLLPSNRPIDSMVMTSMGLLVLEVDGQLRCRTLADALLTWWGSKGSIESTPMVYAFFLMSMVFACVIRAGLCQKPFSPVLYGILDRACRSDENLHALLRKVLDRLGP
jgi:hypothetical protein